MTRTFSSDAAPTQRSFRSAHPKEAECLRHIADLGEALRVSMSAISENKRELLEESLWNQQILCCSLQREIDSVGKSSFGPIVTQRLKEAFVDLGNLNQIYAQLIAQTQDSSATLLDLYLAHKNSCAPFLFDLEAQVSLEV